MQVFRTINPDFCINKNHLTVPCALQVDGVWYDLHVECFEGDKKRDMATVSDDTVEKVCQKVTEWFSKEEAFSGSKSFLQSLLSDSTKKFRIAEKEGKCQYSPNLGVTSLHKQYLFSIHRLFFQVSLSPLDLKGADRKAFLDWLKSPKSEVENPGKKRILRFLAQKLKERFSSSKEMDFERKKEAVKKLFKDKKDFSNEEVEKGFKMLVAASVLKEFNAPEELVKQNIIFELINYSNV